MAASMIQLPLVFLMGLLVLTSGQFFPIHPSPFFLQPQTLIPLPYAHHAGLASGPSSFREGSFSFSPYASASSVAPVAVIPVPVPALPLPIASPVIPGNQGGSSSSSSSSSSISNSESQQETISDRSSNTAKSSSPNSNPFAGFSLKSLQLPNDLADKIFPFTIRIASHGEPHMP